MRGLRLIFAGTPEFAAHHLRVLVVEQNHKVVAVYTQPDRRSGRGKKLMASPVKTVALENHIRVCQPASLKDQNILQQLTEFNADLIVVVAYGLILPKEVLALPRLGCINVHASLLPRWRGAAPIQRAIEAGDSQTGITIMQMDEGLDTGSMLSQAACDILETDTAESVQARLMVIGGELLSSVLAALSQGVVTQQPQDHSLASYAHKLNKEEAFIDWNQSALTLERRVRAFNPAPVAFTKAVGQRLRIWRASPVELEHAEPAGTLLANDQKAILIACGENALSLEEIQLAGKRRMTSEEALRGYSDLFVPGACLG
jgi:methionyl-tRNA formyltransferase